MVHVMVIADDWGPWANRLKPTGQRLRWRQLAALVLIYRGGWHEMLRACIDAEQGGADAGNACWLALLSLPALIRRRLLASYAALTELIDAAKSKSPPKPRGTRKERAPATRSSRRTSSRRRRTSHQARSK
jgi:hypothetical protein